MHQFSKICCVFLFGKVRKVVTLVYPLPLQKPNLLLSSLSWTFTYRLSEDLSYSHKIDSFLLPLQGQKLPYLSLLYFLDHVLLTWFLTPPHFYKGLSGFFWGRDAYAFITSSFHLVLSSPRILILCLKSYYFISVLENVSLGSNHFLFNLNRFYSSPFVQLLSWVTFIELLNK